MRPIVKTAIVGALLIGAGFTLYSPSAVAQFGTGPTKITDPIEIIAPDGGLAITGEVTVLGGRIQADVQNVDGTFLAVAGDTAGTTLRVEATGPALGPVVVSGTVSLSTASLNALNNATCSFGLARHFTLQGTATTIPPLEIDGGYPSYVGRSQVEVSVQAGGAGAVYAVVDTAGFLGIEPQCPLNVGSDGGIPPGVILEHGGTRVFRASSATRVTVIGCTANDIPGGNHQVSFLESACTQ